MGLPIVAFSLSDRVFDLVDAAAAKHKLSASAWARKVVEEMALTAAENATTRVAKRANRKSP